MEAREIRGSLSRDEMKRLTERSDLMGAWSILSTWGVIFGTFAVLARWPYPVTFLVAVVVLGGRQLALAILMHEAAHRTLFRRTFLNDHVTNWLCAWPIWNDVALYKKHHLRHHTHTGTAEDPDLSLAPEEPMTRRSLRRKLARDLLGLTGLKRVLGQALIACGVFEYTVANEPKRRPRDGRTVLDYAAEGVRYSAGFIATNAAIAGVVAATGHAWVLWAWVIAYLTTFSVFVRIRSLAEHACTVRTEDPLRNTRTTIAGPLARMTVAPFRVNYHLEHHLLVAVPWFRLPEAHALLRERGIIGKAPGYADVLRTVSAKPA
jgi:fatty acid desaturase